MRSNSTLLIALVAAFPLVGLAFAQSPEADTTTPIEIRTTARPVSKDRVQLLGRARPGSYRCTAEVWIGGRSTTLLELTVTPDERGKPVLRDVRKTEGARQIAFSVRLEGKDNITTTVTVTGAGRVLARHTSTTWLETEREP